MTFSSPFIGSVTWMVNGVAGGDATNGTIDANGTYTAPAVPPTSPVLISGKLGNFSGVAEPTAQSSVAITNPAPQAAQVSPSAIAAGSSSQVVITGSGFNPQSGVTVNGQAVSTTYIDASHLRISPATNAGTSSVLSLSVSNPAPGGGTSSSLTLFAAATGTPQQTSHPLVAKLSSVLPTGASMFAEFGQDVSYGFKTSTKAASSGASVDLLVAGMKPLTSYHMRLHFVMPDSTDAVGEDEVFTTGDVPAARVPPITVTQTPGMTPSPGIEMFNFVNGSQFQYAATDLAGNLIWYYDFSVPGGTPESIKLLSNGNFGLVIAPGYYREVDLTGHVVREITLAQLNQQLASEGSDIVLSQIHHDFVELPNGMIVLITMQAKSIDNLIGYPDPTQVAGDVLLLVDSNSNIVWKWSEFDHLDINRQQWFPLQPNFPTTTYDWTHTNAILYSARDKALIISIRQQSWIVKIDFNDGQGSGDILWRLGPQGDFSLVGGIDPTDWFYNEHFPSLTTNDGPVFDLAVFDNGNTRSMDSSGTLCGSSVPCYSRPVTMTVDENTKTATLKWAPHIDFSPWGGVSEVLGSNRIEYTLSDDAVTNGGRVVESTMDSSPAEVLRFDSQQFCYRATRIPSLYPNVKW